jgi:DNA-directed RNA polymerase specialized sigma24 family protein
VERELSAKGWLFTILRNIWVNELCQRRPARESVDLKGEGNLVSETIRRILALHCQGDSSCAVSIAPYALRVHSSGTAL